MKIDLHVHIHRTSRCARCEIDEMAQAALNVGLDGIVVLDHNYHATREECDKCMAKFPKLKVFRGAELCFNNDDLVLISENTIHFLPPYQQKMHDTDQMSEWSHSPSNLVILAHPYRRRDQISWNLNKFCPHAIEIGSNHIRKENRPKINQLAMEFEMNTVAVSDAHKTRHLGGYCVDVNVAVDNEMELCRAIKNGWYTPMEKQFAPIII